MQFSFTIKSSFWSTILDNGVFTMNGINAGSDFISSPADALYCICNCGNTLRDRISCFDQDMALRKYVNTSENKHKQTNIGRKSLHDS